MPGVVDRAERTRPYRHPARRQRAEKQVVSAAGAPNLGFRRTPVARADVEAIEIRGRRSSRSRPSRRRRAPHQRPHTSSRRAPSRDSRIRAPGRQHRPEAPELAPVAVVVSRHVAPHGTKVAAAEADHHLVVEHARRDDMNDPSAGSSVCTLHTGLASSSHRSRAAPVVRCRRKRRPFQTRARVCPIPCAAWRRRAQSRAGQSATGAYPCARRRHERRRSRPRGRGRHRQPAASTARAAALRSRSCKPGRWIVDALISVSGL